MKNKGFTLIELIIVIAILGILAAIAIPRFSNYSEKAKINTDIASAKTIAEATVMLYSEGKISIPAGDALVIILDEDRTTDSNVIEMRNFFE